MCALIPVHWLVLRCVRMCAFCRTTCASIGNLFLAEALLDCVCRNLARWMLFVVHLYQDREQRDLQQASAAGHGTCLSGADNSALQQIPYRMLRTGHVRVVTIQIPQINQS